jgi:hypothetical protein
LGGGRLAPGQAQTEAVGEEQAPLQGDFFDEVFADWLT